MFTDNDIKYTTIPCMYINKCQKFQIIDFFVFNKVVLSVIYITILTDIACHVSDPPSTNNNSWAFQNNNTKSVAFTYERN